MPVMIGVDPHKASHTAAVLDEHGQLLDRQRVPATLMGYRALRQWAGQWPQRCWAVEGAHGIGRALAQRLVGDGEHVLDVPAKLAARVRVLSVGHGRKRDPDDALSVAVAARNAGGLRQVKVEDQAVVLHLLTTPARTWLPPGPRPSTGCTGCCWIWSRWRPTQSDRQACRGAPGRGYARWCASAHPLAAGHRARRRRPPPRAAHRHRRCAHQDRGRPIQHQPAGAVRGGAGAGGHVPGRGWRHRPVPDQASFRRPYRHRGLRPPAAVIRHRLSRAGDRRLNRALYMMAMVQVRRPSAGQAYYRRKLAEGKSSKEALRCLKRRLSDAVYRCLLADARSPAVTG